MVGTGVPKFVSMKTIGYIIGGIVIVVAVLVAWHYIRAVFGEFIEYPKTGEKARFMRYMTCALAMCTARNRGGTSACTSDEVMGWIVEYDEGGNPVKGCQEVCYEAGVGIVKEHYCEKAYALNFTFRDEVIYKGNHSISGGLFEKKEVPCKVGRTGFQTDVSCLQNWRNIIECSCLRCPILGDIYPEGRIALIDDTDAGLEHDYGSIYVDDDLLTSANPVNCVPEDVGITNGQAQCTFPEGLEIDIWAENTGHTSNWCLDVWIWSGCSGPPFGICGGVLEGCACQVIGIDEHS